MAGKRHRGRHGRPAAPSHNRTAPQLLRPPASAQAPEPQRSGAMVAPPGVMQMEDPSGSGTVLLADHGGAYGNNLYTAAGLAQAHKPAPNQAPRPQNQWVFTPQGTAPYPEMEQISDKKPLLKSLGAPGTAIFAGIITSEEYNADFYWKDAIQIYEQMIRNDAQIYAITNLLELPIRRATWSIEPASDDPKDIEIASFVESCLFHDMQYQTSEKRILHQKWDDILRHILMMLRFGFMAFEQCYRLEDGWVKWARWTPLLPRTVWRWWVGEDNELVGVQTWTFKDYTYQFIDIPADKMLLFVHRQEGNNYEGVSVLRSAYKHWWYKDNYYKVQSIDIERNAVAMPVIELPENFTTEDVANAQTILANMRVNETMGVTLPPGWKIQYLRTFERNAAQVQPAIEHHDVMIARNVLGQFINLGSTETGAFALDASQKATFLSALQAECVYIEDVINTDAIPRLVDYNYVGVENYPKLKAGKVIAQDFDAVSTALQKLASSGLIHPDPELEDYLREEIGLPMAPKSAVNNTNPTAPVNPARPETDTAEESSSGDQFANQESQNVEPPWQQQQQNAALGTGSNAPPDDGGAGAAAAGSGGLSERERAAVWLLGETLAGADISINLDAVDRGMVFVTDAHGHEHNPPGPGGGQFAVTGGGAKASGGAKKSGGGGGGEGGGGKTGKGTGAKAKASAGPKGTATAKGGAKAKALAKATNPDLAALKGAVSQVKATAAAKKSAKVSADTLAKPGADGIKTKTAAGGTYKAEAVKHINGDTLEVHVTHTENGNVTHDNTYHVQPDHQLGGYKITYANGADAMGGGHTLAAINAFMHGASGMPKLIDKSEVTDSPKLTGMALKVAQAQAGYDKLVPKGGNVAEKMNGPGLEYHLKNGDLVEVHQMTGANGEVKYSVSHTPAKQDISGHPYDPNGFGGPPGVKGANSAHGSNGVGYKWGEGTAHTVGSEKEVNDLLAQHGITNKFTADQLKKVANPWASSSSVSSTGGGVSPHSTTGWNQSQAAMKAAGDKVYEAGPGSKLGEYSIKTGNGDIAVKAGADGKISLTYHTGSGKTAKTETVDKLTPEQAKASLKDHKISEESQRFVDMASHDATRYNGPATKEQQARIDQVNARRSELDAKYGTYTQAKATKLVEETYAKYKGSQAAVKAHISGQSHLTVSTIATQMYGKGNKAYTAADKNKAAAEAHKALSEISEWSLLHSPNVTREGTMRLFHGTNGKSSPQTWASRLTSGITRGTPFTDHWSVARSFADKGAHGRMIVSAHVPVEGVSVWHGIRGDSSYGHEHEYTVGAGKIRDYTIENLDAPTQQAA